MKHNKYKPNTPNQPPAQVPTAAMQRQPQVQTGKLIARQTELNYEGPLPPAEHFKGYEEVLPGAADRILAMAEKEADQRHKNEQIKTEAMARSLTRGQWMGFFITIFFVALIGICIWLDKPLYSIVPIIGSITALVAVFASARPKK